MTKNEKALVDAIESGNKELALDLFAKIQEVKTISDEDKETYFNKIEAIGVKEDASEVPEPAEPVVAETSKVEIVEVEEIKVETRGRKAKDVDRMELERDLNQLVTKALAFNAKVSRNGNGDSIFARRLVQQLSAIRKRLVR